MGMTHGSLSDKLDSLELFISSLPDLIQLLIIMSMLIISLIMYEIPNLSETYLSSFIMLRCIAFFGIIICVYLFLNLLSINNKTTTSDHKQFKSLTSLSYKPYHTKTYKYNKITPRSTSAPPILSTSYQRTPSPINPLYPLPYISNSPNTTSPFLSIPEIPASNYCNNRPQIFAVNECDQNGYYDANKPHVCYPESDGQCVQNLSFPTPKTFDYNQKRIESSSSTNVSMKNESISSSQYFQQRKTTNKERSKVMMRKRRERELRRKLSEQKEMKRREKMKQYQRKRRQHKSLFE